LSGHAGTAATASAASLFNYAGTVNGTGTTGPLTLLDAAVTNPAGIPTLSQWGMMILVGVMGLFGFREMRRRSELLS